MAPLDEGGVEICKERSAIHHLEKITTALGFFQGDEDMVRIKINIVERK